MGRIVSTLSLTKLQKYSLFQKYSARSATWSSVSMCYGRTGRQRTNLEMRAGDRLGQLMEQRLLHLYKLGWVHDLKNILDLIEIHDFLGAVHFRPVAQ